MKYEVGLVETPLVKRSLRLTATSRDSPLDTEIGQRRKQPPCNCFSSSGSGS